MRLGPRVVYLDNDLSRNINSISSRATIIHDAVEVDENRLLCSRERRSKPENVENEEDSADARAKYARSKG